MFKSNMLKLFNAITVIIFIVLINSTIANAEVFTIAQPLDAQNKFIGAEIQSNSKPNNTRVNGYFGYGINSDWDLILKGGFGTNSPMIGADIQYYFGNFEVFKVALKGGVYYLDDLFFNLTPILTHKFKWVSLTTGLALNLKVTDKSELGTNLYAAVNFPINNRFDIRIEGGLKLTDNYYNWLSAGVAYLF